MTARKDVLYFLFQDLSVFSESVWIAIPPLGRVYVCFILIFFEERSLICFFYFCRVVWFYFLMNIVNQSDVCFFFYSTDKIYRSLILWYIWYLFFVCFSFLFTFYWWVKLMRCTICLMCFWCVRSQTVWWISLSINWFSFSSRNNFS